jgi:chromosome segregation ATPase
VNKKNIIIEIENLAKKNNALFEENKELKTEKEELLSKISLLQKEIDILTVTIAEKETYISELESQKCKDSLSESVEITIDDALNIETPVEIVINDTVIKNEEKISTDYGSGVDLASTAIGSVVLKCSELCAHFAETGGPNAKDLINLALGRTEVFKSEALSVIEAFDDISEISAELNKRMENTFDYFDLLKKQI